MWLRHHKLNDHEQKLVDMPQEEFDKYMMSNYADMFKKRIMRDGQEVIYPMNFGFEIGPGWRHVLDSLCSKLSVIQGLTGCVCVFDQIKEKFGGARFYKHTELMEGKEELQDTKLICDIIDDLVNLHEEYCDYVCEELGTNIKPEEKVAIGGWYYGMGIEGFKKVAKKRGEGSTDRIKIAEEYLSKRKKEKDIYEQFYVLSSDDLDRVEKAVKDMIQEAIRRQNENCSD